MGDRIGMSGIGVCFAVQRDALGVSGPNVERAKTWAKRQPPCPVGVRPCCWCGRIRRLPGDDLCFDHARLRRDAL